ncbi:hypothetical protein [Candidatus Viridilinea mediisalina]|uniref:hypothetical protein n=1 Tax=Candidatus Viridilinea mediisalina TaxID=2024553 RepID=UPI000F59FF6B|nr:hypothetical protein [Candidatus Viridilinea mediisalina]
MQQPRAAGLQGIAPTRFKCREATARLVYPLGSGILAVGQNGPGGLDLLDDHRRRDLGERYAGRIHPCGLLCVACVV